MASRELAQLIDAFNDLVVQHREMRREMAFMRDMMAEMAARYHKMHCVRENKLKRPESPFDLEPKPPKPPKDPPHIPVFKD